VQDESTEKMMRALLTDIVDQMLEKIQPDHEVAVSAGKSDGIKCFKLWDYDACFEALWTILNRHDPAYGLADFEGYILLASCKHFLQEDTKKTIDAFMVYLKAHFPKEHERHLPHQGEQRYMKGVIIEHIEERVTQSALGLISNSLETDQPVFEILPASRRASKVSDVGCHASNVNGAKERFRLFPQSIRQFGDDLEAAKSLHQLPIRLTTIIDIAHSLSHVKCAGVQWSPESVLSTALREEQVLKNADDTKLAMLIPTLQWIGRRYPDEEISVEFLDDSLRKLEDEGEESEDKDTVWLLRESVSLLAKKYANLIPKNVHLTAYCYDGFLMKDIGRCSEAFDRIFSSNFDPDAFEVLRDPAHFFEFTSIQGTGEFMSDDMLAACAQYPFTPFLLSTLPAKQLSKMDAFLADIQLRLASLSTTSPDASDHGSLKCRP
jgi:hypothetical protein